MPKEINSARQIKKTGKQLTNLDHELKSVLQFSKNSSDRITTVLIQALGSIKFLVFCIISFAIWIGWNLLFFQGKPFDPFPFPVLQIMVSLFAIILSVSVLINQNRQRKIDEVKSQVEFEVNVRAENEITKLLTMVHEIHQKLGLDSNDDIELEKMKERTDIKQIHQTLENMEIAIDQLSDAHDPEKNL